MNIQIRRATKEEQPIIENMTQFYIYEFGPLLDGIHLRDDGFYQGLSDLDLYWRDPICHPFLVTVDDKLAGFVLVSAGHADVPNNIDQFFIVRKFMGRGVGGVVAKRVFDMFPGRWRVTQIQKNYAAQAFWRTVIGTYTQDQFTEYYDETRRSIQEFENYIDTPSLGDTKQQ